MHRFRRGVVVASVGACALAATAAPGSAAPGGGAVVVPSTCTVSVPGLPDAVGPAKVVLTPSGKKHITCQAALPTGSAPAKTVTYQAGPCAVIVSTSGSVQAVCTQ